LEGTTYYRIRIRQKNVSHDEKVHVAVIIDRKEYHAIALSRLLAHLVFFGATKSATTTMEATQSG
jgi:hypothetical protein